MSLYRDLTHLVAGDPVFVSVPGYRMHDDPGRAHD